MNIFDVRVEIRKIGLNYGAPCFMVEGGPGISYKNEALAKKLASLGLRKKGLVVFKDCCGEMGIGTMVEGLKFSGVTVEVETLDILKDPGWFTRVDNWVIFWTGSKTFNLGGLRRGWDIVICREKERLEEFAIWMKDSNVGRGYIGELSAEEALRYGVRVYKES